jgi:O-antigen ligase
MKNALVDGTRKSSIAYKQRELGFAPAVVMALSVFLLLRIPADYRDPLFLAGTVVCFAFALHNFAGVWRFFLLVLPFVHIVGSLFGLSQVSVTRMFLVCMAFIFCINKKESNFWKTLLQEFGLVAFILFFLANLLSGIRTLQIEAVFRSITYLEPLLFFVLTYYIVKQDSANFRRILRAVIVGGVIVALLGLVEILTQQSIFNLLGVELPGLHENFGLYLEIDRLGLGGRIMSTIGQPVYASMYFVIWLVVSTYYVLIFQPKFRSLLLILIPIGILLILATGSRAPLLSLIPVLLALVFFSRQRPLVSVTVGLGAVFAAVLVFVLRPELIAYLQASTSLGALSPENANLLGRIDLTNNLLDLFRQSPIFGNGPGLIQKAALQGSAQFEGLGGLENQYAVILADGGILAGATYLLFMLASLRSLSKIRSAKNRETGSGAFMIFLLFIFYFVVTASVTSITLIPNYLLMVLYGAIVARYDHEKTPLRRS